MGDIYRMRRIIVAIVSITLFVFVIISNTPNQAWQIQPVVTDQVQTTSSSTTLDVLAALAVKGRAPKTDYTREKFGANWTIKNGCDTRNIILNRDLINSIVDEKCNVISGTLNDPYSGKIIQFKRGSDTSGAVQIDHVVALSDAWQKGAQQFTSVKRIELANDPLELLAVDGDLNMQKSDGDAATWLPPNKSFRCQYVARQIAVKQKYGLWVTQAEYDAMMVVLDKCPGQLLPSP